MPSKSKDEKPRLPLQFWIVALIAFINSVSFTIIIPTLYPYAKQFGLSDFEASLLTTAYSLSQFVGTPILGQLSDRWGRKPLLVISLIGTVISNLLAAIAGVPGLLFCARIFDGLTGGNNSVAQAVISDITTPEQRTQAFGIYSGLFRLGFVAGPPMSYLAQLAPPIQVGGLEVSSLGMSFLVSAAIALVAAAMCFFFLKETQVDHQSIDTTDTVESSSTGSTPTRSLPTKRITKKFDFVSLFTALGRPVIGRILLMTFLNGATFTIFTFAFQPFFINVLGQDAKNLAIAFVAFGILAFVSQVFALEPLRKRFTLVNVLVGALIARGFLFLLMPALPNIVAFSLLLACFGLVNAFPMPLIDSILSTRSNQAEQGEVLGLNASYLSISNAIGPAISGLLVTTFGYSFPFWVAGALTMMVAGFALTLKQPETKAI
ncbi:transporter, major facilitator family [Synechococcus sp. PCC 7335]|uniref:MFS transporter n=1 Tax=Synechococcus sp. (strain ATCC 29403 / PCC 7335) TaxID=91464 RepID=UPI00017EBC2C|nr:MFS transporter [Synechococcus sp. PCC 7335]EDX87228.1 transporter, major facilitator family [Synechococcus sp. PCC 7335]